jgi:hypothetical protein
MLCTRGTTQRRPVEELPALQIVDRADGDSAHTAGVAATLATARMILSQHGGLLEQPGGADSSAQRLACVKSCKARTNVRAG